MSDVEFKPTKIPPGVNKVAVLRERADAGLPLWHPDDELSAPSPLTEPDRKQNPHRAANKRVAYALVDIRTLEVMHSTFDAAEVLAIHVDGETVFATSEIGRQDATGKAIRKAARTKELI